MQKRILYALVALCVILLVANLFFLVLIFQKTLQTPSGNQTQPVVQAQTAAPAPEDIVPGTIGTQAGEAFGELQTKSEKAYEDLSVQAKKTTQELEKTTGEAAQVLNQQFEKTMKELETFSSEMLAALQVELEKFQEAIKKKKAS